jgi:hypothetical protein
LSLRSRRLQDRASAQVKEAAEAVEAEEVQLRKQRVP